MSTKILRCPICRTNSENVPFCSDRCRSIDLGKWAAGEYKIASPILDPDLLEELEHKQQQTRPMGTDSGKEWKN